MEKSAMPPAAPEQVAGYIPQRPMPCSLAPQAAPQSGQEEPEDSQKTSGATTQQPPTGSHQQTGADEQAALHLRGGCGCADCCVYACGIVAFIKVLDCVCD